MPPQGFPRFLKRAKRPAAVWHTRASHLARATRAHASSFTLFLLNTCLSCTSDLPLRRKGSPLVLSAQSTSDKRISAKLCPIAFNDTSPAIRNTVRVRHHQWPHLSPYRTKTTLSRVCSPKTACDRGLGRLKRCSRNALSRSWAAAGKLPTEASNMEER